MRALLVALAAEETTYKYLNPGGILFDLTALIVGLSIGLVLACVAAVIQKQFLGRFFRVLIQHQAESPETAKTLAELGIVRAPFLRRSLLSPLSPVRKLVFVRLPDGRVLAPPQSLDDRLAEETERAEKIAAGILPKDDDTATVASSEVPAGSVGERVRFLPQEAAYFLDDRHRRRAELRYNPKGSDVWLLLPALLVIGGVLAALLAFLPDLLSLLDTLLASLFG